MDTQTTLPFPRVAQSELATCEPPNCALPFGSRLLAPHRAAVDRCEKGARAALAAMDEECKGTMAWDSCEDAIDHRNLCWLYNSRDDVKHNLWDAEHLREGYDTWERPALRKHIEQLKQLLDAMTMLIDAINHLAQREAEEFSANAKAQPDAQNL